MRAALILATASLAACSASPHVLGEVPRGDPSDSGSTTADATTSTMSSPTSVSTSNSTSNDPDTSSSSSSAAETAAPDECVQQGDAELCASLDSVDSGAVVTLTRADPSGCLGVSLRSQVGTGTLFPNITGPSDWEINAIWFTDDATACGVCGGTPAGAPLATDAAGVWSWIDGAVDMDITATFPTAEHTIQARLSPTLCF